MATVAIKQPKVFTKLVGQSLKVSDELRTLVYHLVTILDVKMCANIEYIFSELKLREVSIDSIETLTMYLELGVGSGFFKRMTSNEVVFYTLNKKRKKAREVTKKVKAHTRPNRGIGVSIVNLLNKNKENKLFDATIILKLLADSYPDANVRTVDAVLRLIHRKQPLQLIYGNGLYIRKGTINYIDVSKTAKASV